ncbi:hypothetical protein BMIN_3000 [Bifidobacterium minimum]|uniref:Uncharacterized protein n=1 Tax=Bifidobacterium minimum TaxID=1693 RepID=A0A087BT48_9BIFI|nr:hypothetical protein BMIN_3000 [Bifidobacterium minimum]
MWGHSGCGFPVPALFASGCPRASGCFQSCGCSRSCPAFARTSVGRGACCSQCSDISLEKKSSEW